MNERDSIGPLVNQIHRHCPGVDVLVVDDGSTDDTFDQIPPNTFVVRLPFNLGIGGAMQTGYRYAHLHDYDVAVQVDGDGQHRPLEVRKLLSVMKRERADMVIGSRFVPGNSSYRQTMGRWAGGQFLNKLIYWLSGLRLTDCTSGFRAVNKRVIRVFAHWYPEDYPEPQVALLLARSGFKIVETPSRMRQRMTGLSSISFIRGFYYILKVGVCLVLDTCRNPWPTDRASRSAAASETFSLTGSESSASQ